jgi:hypothetical protein
MKIHFTRSAKPAPQHTAQQLIDRYGQNDLANAAYVVAIGDGTALNTLRSVMATPSTAVFAMRLPGSVGALANVLQLDRLTRPPDIRKACDATATQGGDRTFKRRSHSDVRIQ